MRLACGKLLVTFLLGIMLSGSLAAPTNTDLHQTNQLSPKLRTGSPLFIPSTSKPVPIRRLSLYDTANVIEGTNNEEKAGISDLWKFTENLSFNWMLKMNANPNDVFKKLHLAKDGVKLDDNPVFIRWLQYVHLYKKQRFNYFYDVEMYQLLRKSQSDDDLVTLFHNLRQVPEMKNLADKMQRIMLGESPSSNQLMYQVWLTNKESPKEVFKILGLQDVQLNVENTAFLDWLRYTELYRNKMGANSFSELQTLHYLIDTTMINEAKLGKVLQTVKEIPDLQKLAESMQTHLFQTWMHLRKTNPQEFGDILMLPYGTWRSLVAKPKDKASFQTLKAYTLRYAEDLGEPGVLKQVEGFLADNDLEAAISAVMKISNS